MVYQLGFQLLAIVPGLLYSYFIGLYEPTADLGWRYWSSMLVFAGTWAILALPGVRLIALAVSGNRIRLSAIASALTGHLAMLMLALFVVSLLAIGGEVVEWAVNQVARNARPAQVVLGSLVEAFGSVLQLCMFTAAYLHVDRHADGATLREIFA